MKITNIHHKPIRFNGKWVKPQEQADVDIPKHMKERLVKLGHIKLKRTRKKVKPVEEQQPDVERDNE